MVSKLLPVILLIVGTGAGVGTALLLDGGTGHEKGSGESAHAENNGETGKASGDAGEEVKPETEFARLNNQFVVPLVTQDRVSSLVVVSLSLEVKSGTTENVYSREPKLRDVFLRVLFDHANMGGFRGSFTDSHNLELLRTALREVARKELGADLKNVLITDIARQDT